LGIPILALVLFHRTSLDFSREAVYKRIHYDHLCALHHT
jgi:hypothetical protein